MVQSVFSWETRARSQNKKNRGGSQRKRKESIDKKSKSTEEKVGRDKSNAILVASFMKGEEEKRERSS